MGHDVQQLARLTRKTVPRSHSKASAVDIGPPGMDIFELFLPKFCGKIRTKTLSWHEDMSDPEKDRKGQKKEHVQRLGEVEQPWIVLSFLSDKLVLSGVSTRVAVFPHLDMRDVLPIRLEPCTRGTRMSKGIQSTVIKQEESRVKNWSSCRTPSEAKQISTRLCSREACSHVVLEQP